MNSSTLTAFFFNHELVTLPKGADLIHHDEPVKFVYQIKSGLVKEFMLSEQGIELTLDYYSAPAIIPLATGKPGHSCYQAHIKTELYRVADQEFADFLAANQDIARSLSQDVSLKYAAITHRLGCLVFCHARARIIESLLFVAQKYGQTDGQRGNIPPIFTHKDIASLAGTTRETASFEISRLAKEGLIKANGRTLIIPDQIRLTAELEHHKEKK